jgi:hypothetical protein
LLFSFESFTLTLQTKTFLKSKGFSESQTIFVPREFTRMTVAIAHPLPSRNVMNLWGNVELSRLSALSSDAEFTGGGAPRWRGAFLEASEY